MEPQRAARHMQKWWRANQARSLFGTKLLADAIARIQRIDLANAAADAATDSAAAADAAASRASGASSALVPAAAPPHEQSPPTPRPVAPSPPSPPLDDRFADETSALQFDEAMAASMSLGGLRDLGALLSRVAAERQRELNLLLEREAELLREKHSREELVAQLLSQVNRSRALKSRS